MNRKISLIILIFLTIYACQFDNHAQLNQLDFSESLLQKDPAGALLSLQQIDVTGIKQEKNLARFALLMSAALDKNYIDVASDSLIKKAVDYYDGAGNQRYAMLAWYYEGVVLKNAQSYPSSIVAFEKAAKIAADEKDYYQLGLIHRSMAGIYNLTNNNTEAIRNRKKAVQFLERADKPVYQAYTELALAIDYFNNRDYSQADSLLTAIQHKYDIIEVLHQSHLIQADIMVEEKRNPDSALVLYRMTPHRYFRVLHCGYYATALDRSSQRDSVNHWLSVGYSLCRDHADSTTLDYVRAKIEMNRGQHEEAFRLINHAASVQDSLTRILLRQSASAALRDYYKSETLLQEQMIQTMRQRVIFATIACFLLFGLLMIAAVSISRKRDHQLQEQMVKIALEERELARFKRDNAHLVGSLFCEKMNHLDRLFEAFLQMENGKEKEQLFRHIKQIVAQLRKDPSVFLSLEKDLDRYCNGIMSKLRAQVPSIKGENLWMIALFFSGVSYNAVQLILNKQSVESLKTARSRFRKEIKTSGATDAEFFLQMLEVKKRPQAGTNENLGAC